MNDSRFVDDAAIPNEADLWRRIPPWHFVSDETTGGRRVSSAAFDNDPDGQPMSVFLASVMEETCRGPADTVLGHVGFGLASFTAGLARSCGQGVASDPEPDEPAHAVVFGRKTDSVRNKLRRGSRLLIVPTAAL